MPRDAAPARHRMIDVAARIAAERGLSALTLRAVQQASGQANKSAAHYHFGSRDGLVAAIVTAGMAPVNERRLARLDALTADHPLRDLVETLIVPLAEMTVGRPGSTYARFLHQGLADPAVQRIVTESLTAASYLDVRRRILEHPEFSAAVPPPLRRSRLDHAVITFIAALAFWEGAVANDSLPPADVPTDARLANLIDVTLAVLATPSSTTTHDALRAGSSQEVH